MMTPIVRTLKANAGSRDLRTVFTDFCEASAIAIRNRVDSHGFREREESVDTDETSIDLRRSRASRRRIQPGDRRSRQYRLSAS